MPITAAEIAPLITGTYTDQAAVWRVLKDIILPRFADKLRALAPRESSVTPDDFVREVIAILTVSVIEKRGISAPTPPPPADYTAWLRVVLTNRARDYARQLRRWGNATEHDETNQASTEAPAVETSEPDARRERLAALAQRSPLYVIGLYCWIAPRWIDRPLLEAAAATPDRGRSSSGAGLVRSVDATWQLLQDHRREVVAGAERNRPVCERLAWIFRSDSLDFITWQANRRAVKSANETLYSWNKRARRQLEQDRTAPDAEDT